MGKRMKSCCTVLPVLVQDHSGECLLAQVEDVFAVREGDASHAFAVKVQAPLRCSLHAEGQHKLNE